MDAARAAHRGVGRLSPTGLSCWRCPFRAAPSRSRWRCAVLVGMLALVVGASTWPRPRLMAALACCVVLSGVVTFTCYLSALLQLVGHLPHGRRQELAVPCEQRGRQVHRPAAQTGGYDETYRYDRTSAVGSGVHNSNLITGHMSPDYYNSIYNQGNRTTSTRAWGSLTPRAPTSATAASTRVACCWAFWACATSTSTPPTPSCCPRRSGMARSSRKGRARADYYYLYETDEVAPLAFVTDRLQSRPSSTTTWR